MSPVKWLTDQEYQEADDRTKVLAWADSFNGQKEVGQNAGPFVAEVLKSVGLPTGHAWCAAFVSYCFSKAKLKVGPKKHRYRVKAWADWARDSFLVHYKPKRGDLFYWVNRDGTGHIGFVLTEADFAGEFKTLEGNTSPGGSREGHGVYKRKRHVSEKVSFIRW